MILNNYNKDEYKIVFFGASKALEKITQDFPSYKVDFVCDNDVNKHNKVIYGYKICHPDKIFLKYPDDEFIVIITSMYYKSIFKQISRYGNRLYKCIHYMKLYDSEIDNDLDLIADINTDKVLVFTKYKRPLVSIIIPVYNEWEYTYKCLVSILKHTKDIEYEVIIADDVSTDNTINISKIIKNVNVVRNKHNLKFLRNCNSAAKYAKGKYIHLLNNDVQVQKNWLSSLVDLIESDESIGMVGSKLVYPNGRQQEAGCIVWNDGSAWNFGRLQDPEASEYNYVKEVDYISGASIMIRRKLWEEIGGLDDRYAPAYCEDADLAFEIRKHGYKVLLQPKSVIIHFEGISHGTDINHGIKQYQVVNKKKFQEKWKEELEKNHFSSGEDVFFARDRTSNKKQILIIDHKLPTYDQDAGSRTMFDYLKMFVELGYKVTFIADDLCRREPYATELENLGIELLYSDAILYSISKWLKDNCKYFDFIYLIRPSVAIKYIAVLKKYKNSNTKIFYNGTDFHFLRLEREYDISKNETTLKHSKKMRQIEYTLFNLVDRILTISSYEKDFYERIFKTNKIKLIPTFIYKNSLPLSEKDFSQREGVLFIGGFLHQPNSVGLKWFFDNVWKKIMKMNSNLVLNIAGANMPEEIINYCNENKNINNLGFISDNELDEVYHNIKVVIAPLTYGAGVKGKVIESIAYGVPVVTTSIGAEGIVNNSKLLSITDNASEFAKKLVDLYTNETLWNEYRRQEIEYSNLNMEYTSVKNTIKEIFQ